MGTVPSGAENKGVVKGSSMCICGSMSRGVDLSLCRTGHSILEDGNASEVKRSVTGARAGFIGTQEVSLVICS